MTAIRVIYRDADSNKLGTDLFDSAGLAAKAVQEWIIDSLENGDNGRVEFYTEPDADPIDAIHATY